MSARAQAGAQNNQQDESPFRKFIAIAQVRACSCSNFQVTRSLPSSEANSSRLCGDTVR